MIIDFFNLEDKSGKLFNEISEIENREEISPNQAEALKALKDIGNIGAHPNEIVDVQPNEAKLMITNIELFMEQWYIRRHNDKEMMSELISISKQKKELKRSGHPKKRQK